MVKVIENYVLSEPIGEGNYGVVYHATNKNKPNQQFAVKVIPIQKFHENEKLETYTNNEIQALSVIGSADNIIKYYEMIKSKNNYYFIYEYCDGGTLLDLLKKQPKLEEKVALLILKQLIEGFKVLNRNNIMHRDLKPENIFFTTVKSLSDPKIELSRESLFNRIKKQRVKIGDFGFCKGMKPEQNLTKTMLGSPIYMAPEVLKGESYTSKADIWAIGVLLYEMLYGVCPYQSNSIAMLINTIDNRSVTIPSDIPVSDKTKKLILRMLTKDFYRRIGWAQLFGYKINDDGQYIEQEIECKKRNVFASLVSVPISPPQPLNHKDKSSSMRQQNDHSKILSFKNSKTDLRIFHSPTNNNSKQMELSIRSNKADKFEISNNSPKHRKQNFSTPKQERRFHSEKYMSIFSTPFVLKKNQEKEGSIDQNKPSKLQPHRQEQENKESIEWNRDRAKTGTRENIIENDISLIHNREEKVMSLVDLKDRASEQIDSDPKSPNMTSYDFNHPQSHKFICSKQQPTAFETPQSPKTLNTPQSPTFNTKRQSLLAAHEKIVKILLKTATLMEQRLEYLKMRNNQQKQNQETAMQDFLHDMYLVLKLLQQKLKEITLAIRITETNLLDMASIISYQLIQVQRMLIQVRNQIIQIGITMPQWSNSIIKNEEEGDYDRQWECDLSVFRVKEIKGFLMECK